MENQYDPDRLLTIDEAAALLHVKPGTLYSWISKGKIPYRKVGSLVRFHRDELMAWTTGKVQGFSRPHRVSKSPKTSKLKATHGKLGRSL